ncbi:unnamed protein product [Lampetra fluviatilis]
MMMMTVGETRSQAGDCAVRFTRNAEDGASGSARGTAAVVEGMRTGDRAGREPEPRTPRPTRVVTGAESSARIGGDVGAPGREGSGTPDIGALGTTRPAE